MISRNLNSKPLNYTSTKRIKREKSFDLPVPILISGMDARGNEFQEQSKLSSISSQQATFWLNSAVTIGSRLNLSLDIPKTVVLERHLKLLLTGVVVFVKGETNLRKKQMISVRLDKKYKIRTLTPKK
jgi:hypothetical protein